MRSELCMYKCLLMAERSEAPDLRMLVPRSLDIHGSPQHVTWASSLVRHGDISLWGSGRHWKLPHRGFKQKDRYGSSGSVGAAGGWIQGGGHSNLSPSYDLGTRYRRLTPFSYDG